MVALILSVEGIGKSTAFASIMPVLVTGSSNQDDSKGTNFANFSGSEEGV
jgi:hypothetical protein